MTHIDDALVDTNRHGRVSFRSKVSLEQFRGVAVTVNVVSRGLRDGVELFEAALDLETLAVVA